MSDLYNMSGVINKTFVNNTNNNMTTNPVNSIFMNRRHVVYFCGTIVI